MRKIGLSYWAIGDSITNGYDLTDTTQRYADLIKESLKNSNHVYYMNDGHNSWTSTMLLSLTKSKSKNFDADIITILCSTNDITNSISSSTTQSNLTNMVNSIKQNSLNGSCDIYLCSPTPRFDGNDVTPVVNAVRNAATATGVNFVDLSTILPDATYTFDNLHPTVAGHNLMFNAIWSAINARSSIWNKY